MRDLPFYSKKYPYSFMSNFLQSTSIRRFAHINLTALVCLIISTTVQAEALYLPNQINYGQVITHQTYKIDATYGRGAVAGAIAGAVIAENDRGWGALGGALIGAGLEAAVTSGQETHQVVIQLASGQSFSVATPPNNLRTGDCVAVEQTPKGAELMKVNYRFCKQAKQDVNLNRQQAPSTPANDSQVSKESRCSNARSRLRHASDDQYNQVLADVQQYCQ